MGYRQHEFEPPSGLELSPLCNDISYDQLEGEFRHGYVGGLVSIWYRDGSEYNGAYVSSLPDPPRASMPDTPSTFDEELKLAPGMRTGRHAIADAGGRLFEVAMQAVSPIPEHLLPASLRGSEHAEKWLDAPSPQRHPVQVDGKAASDPLDLNKVPAAAAGRWSPGSDQSSLAGSNMPDDR